MNQRQATKIDKVAYVLILAFACGFWVFGAYVTGLMLSMSLRGRFDGGPLVNIGTTVFAFTWLSGVSAFVVAIWKWRKVSGDMQLVRLARMRRPPSDPAEAAVWPWMRAAWWAWLFIMASMGVVLVGGLLGFW